MLPAPPMSLWLEEALAAPPTEEAESYLLGRGAKTASYQELGITVWTPPPTPAPDQAFHKPFGARGEKIAGWLMCPYRTPAGMLVGFGARDLTVKKMVEYRLPISKWHPIMVGLPRALDAMWRGQRVWVVEGLFDLFALEWAYGGPVVAAGTAKLSPRQTEFMRRFASDVLMVFDMDPPGRRGSSEAVYHLRRAGVRCNEIAYAGKDPGVVWDRGGAVGVLAEFGPHT